MSETPVPNTNGEAPQKRTFTKKLKEIKVDIDGEEYTIKELMGGYRNQYLNVQRQKVDVHRREDGEAEVTLKDFSGQGSDLLAYCLYDPKGQLVTSDVIDAYPSEMQMELYKMAADLSGLTKKGEAEAKKPLTTAS
jgi:hypothetical protein